MKFYHTSGSRLTRTSSVRIGQSRVCRNAPRRGPPTQEVAHAQGASRPHLAWRSLERERELERRRLAEGPAPWRHKSARSSKPVSKRSYCIARSRFLAGAVGQEYRFPAFPPPPRIYSSSASPGVRPWLPHQLRLHFLWRQQSPLRPRQQTAFPLVRPGLRGRGPTSHRGSSRSWCNQWGGWGSSLRQLRLQQQPQEQQRPSSGQVS